MGEMVGMGRLAPRLILMLRIKLIRRRQEKMKMYSVMHGTEDVFFAPGFGRRRK
jgi:hypothetical protein